MNLNNIGAAMTTDNIIFIIIIAIAVMGMIFFQYTSNKKKMQKAESFADTLRPGMDVVTYSGMFGRIKEIREVGLTKEVLIDVGSPKAPNQIRIDISAILDLDRREEIAAAKRAEDAKKIKVEPKKQEPQKEEQPKETNEITEYVKKRNEKNAK